MPLRRPRSWPPPSNSGAQPDRRIAAAHVQHADPFGGIDFVSRKAQKIDRAGLRRQRHFADGLRGVGVKDDASLVAKLADLGDRIERPDLVIGGHHRDQDRAIGECIGE